MFKKLAQWAECMFQKHFSIIVLLEWPNHNIVFILDWNWKVAKIHTTLDAKTVHLFYMLVKPDTPSEVNW